ncbi:PREDICTED: uncharacterized protein LOC105133188 isoform X2 [Populus euphratica]|uniref:Uncharacterized protein LOC105133188 isoform X2 n=1 Tax=Populus euphratica TaxID=75702 RepID=A0AAJ6UU80_POPEU|nr:PREDICTED: uncharacterized protein LOC105133188 isoform X2 [Populus euphratica]
MAYLHALTTINCLFCVLLSLLHAERGKFLVDLMPNYLLHGAQIVLLFTIEGRCCPLAPFREIFCWSVDTLQLAVTNFSADKHAWWIQSPIKIAASSLQVH